MVAGAPTIAHRAAGLPRVGRAGLRAGRPQRAVRRRLPARRPPSGSTSPGPASRRSTPPGSPAGCSPATRRPTASSRRCPGCSGPTTEPCHRALADARATVDVLHGLIERLGGLGVHSLEELRTFSGQVSAAQRRKRHLAEGLPDAPGVYVFRDGRGRLLYIGKSRSLRTRVRHYFVGVRDRAPGWPRWSGLAERVDAVVCAHALEAEVRELRLIAEHKPRYNRRSRFPERAIVRQAHRRAVPPAVAGARGARRRCAPTSARSGHAAAAEHAMAALHEAFPLRQCTEPALPAPAQPRCALAEMGRCGAPCEGRETRRGVRRPRRRGPHRHDRRPRAAGRGPAHAARALAAERALRGGRRAPRPAGRFRPRRRPAAAAVGARRRAPPGRRGAPGRRRLGPGRRAARPARGAPASPRPVSRPRPYVDALVATAETVRPGPGPTPAPAPRRWSACCAGSSSRGPGWSSSTGSGTVRPSAPGACAAGSTGR